LEGEIKKNIENKQNREIGGNLLLLLFPAG
jgi:hypothetical protein